MENQLDVLASLSFPSIDARTDLTPATTNPAIAVLTATTSDAAATIDAAAAVQ